MFPAPASRTVEDLDWRIPLSVAPGTSIPTSAFRQKDGNRKCSAPVQSSDLVDQSPPLKNTTKQEEGLCPGGLAGRSMAFSGKNARQTYGQLSNS